MYEFNMEMLDYRMNKVLSMDVTGSLDKEKQAEYLMAFDSMLILFRSLFLEKKVCHQDSISYDEYGLCNVWMAKLKNPYFDKNLNYITNRLNNILKIPIKWNILE